MIALVLWRLAAGAMLMVELELIGLSVAWVSGSSGVERSRVQKADRGAAGGQRRVRGQAHAVGRERMTHVIVVGLVMQAEVNAVARHPEFGDATFSTATLLYVRCKKKRLIKAI